MLDIIHVKRRIDPNYQLVSNSITQVAKATALAQQDNTSSVTALSIMSTQGSSCSSSASTSDRRRGPSMKRGKHCNLAKRSNRPSATSIPAQGSSTMSRRDSAVIISQAINHDTSSIIRGDSSGSVDPNQHDTSAPSFSLSLPDGNSLLVTTSPAPTTKRGRSTNWRYEDSDEPYPTEYEAFQLIEALSAASAKAPEDLRTHSHGRAASTAESEVSSHDASTHARPAETSAIPTAARVKDCDHGARRPKLILRCVRRPESLTTLADQRTILPSEAMSCMTPPHTDHDISHATSVVESDDMDLTADNDVVNYDDMLDNLDDFDPYPVHFTLSKEDIRWSMQNRAGVVPVTLLLKSIEEKRSLERTITAVQVKLAAAVGREGELESDLDAQRAESGRLSRVAQSLDHDNRGLQSRLDDQQAQMSVLEKTNSQLKAWKAKISKEYKDLKSESFSQNIQIQEARNQLDTLQGSSLALRQAYHDAKDKAWELHISSQAAEAELATTRLASEQLHQVRQELATIATELHATEEARDKFKNELTIRNKLDKQMHGSNLLLEVELAKLQNTLTAANKQKQELQVNKLLLECQLVEAQKDLAASHVVRDRQAKMIDDSSKTIHAAHRTIRERAPEARIATLEAKLRKETSEWENVMRTKVREIAGLKSRLAAHEDKSDLTTSALDAGLRAEVDALPLQLAELERQRVSAMAYFSRPATEVKAITTIAEQEVGIDCKPAAADTNSTSPAPDVSSASKQSPHPNIRFSKTAVDLKISADSDSSTMLTSPPILATKDVSQSAVQPRQSCEPLHSPITGTASVGSLVQESSLAPMSHNQSATRFSSAELAEASPFSGAGSLEAAQGLPPSETDTRPASWRLVTANLPASLQATPVSVVKPELRWTPYKVAAGTHSRTPSLSVKPTSTAAEQVVVSSPTREKTLLPKRSWSTREQRVGSSPTQSPACDTYIAHYLTDERPFKRRKVEGKTYYRRTPGF